MNNKLIDYLLKTLLDLPPHLRTPKKFKATLNLISDVVTQPKIIQIPESTNTSLKQNAEGASEPGTTLIRIDGVVATVGLARSTIYKLLRQPESNFPQPVKLSKSNAKGAPVAWVLAEVQQWVQSRVALRDQPAAENESTSA